MAPGLCPRYSARVIKNIKVGESPQWLKTAVENVGMRSINNVVDATNFVMLELGQPLHAFDLSLIKRKKIIVRRPTSEETKFITLDGKGRTITGDMLMICDAEQITAIAGVMGGMNSEINPETKVVLIESANFSPWSIRKTSKALGLSTEASYRFERGVDPNLTLTALDRVAEIISETAGGEVAKGIIDVAAGKFASRKIELRVENVNKLLGTRLSSGEIKRFLDSIEIQCEKKSETVLSCWVPTFRGDIEREIDLIEEVARVYGYEKIDDSWQTKLVFDARFKQEDLASNLKNFLAGAGFNEIVTNSLQSAPLDGTAAHGVDYVKIANPISEDMAVMRTTMLPSALHVISTNLSFGTKNLKLFEIGKVYSQTAEQHTVANFLEHNVLSMVFTGAADPHSYDRKVFEFDIFDSKSEIGRLFGHLNLDYWDFISYDSDKAYEQSLEIIVNGVMVGMVGRVARDVSAKFGIEQSVHFAQIDLDGLESSIKVEEFPATHPAKLDSNRVGRYKPISRFPLASIDLAFIVNVGTPVGELIKAIRNVASTMVRDVSVFDIYSGDGIPDGKKSVAFNVALGNDERTLNDSDIARFIGSAEDLLEKLFSANLRKQSTQPMADKSFNAGMITSGEGR